FELTVDGEPLVLEPGMVAVIPGGVPHSGVALTPCRLLDAFHPVREDYQ
ncbi:MAG: cupin domain-containing protein, partial [Anaerolineales bacterium]|nr:cupin domain-containing protein [Anaerolineales bacterium]